MSNAYAERLAPMAQAAAPDGIAIEAHANCPGELLYWHRNGHRGVINLRDMPETAGDPVDNRRVPVRTSVESALTLMAEHARRDMRDARIKPHFRELAAAAYDALSEGGHAA